MVETRASCFKELCHCAVRACRLEKLKLCVSDLKECGLYFLVCNYFCLVAFETKNILIVRESLLYAIDGDADVFEM